MKSVLFTGASGYLGSTIIQTFLCNKKVSKSFDIKVASYVVDEIHRKAKPKWKGEVHECFEIDPSSRSGNLSKAFENVDYAVLIPWARSKSVEMMRNMISVCKSNGVQHIIVLSQYVPGRDSLIGMEYKEVEELVEFSNINYTIIRLGILTHRLHWFKEDIINKVLPLPTKNGRFAPLNEQDVGEMINILLQDIGVYKNKYYTLTGPELFDGRQIARVISQVLDMNVEFVDIKESAAEKLLFDSGVDEKKSKVSNVFNLRHGLSFLPIYLVVHMRKNHL
jgi:uncharacterized protein YbjT (DUF2867 family)